MEKIKKIKNVKTQNEKPIGSFQVLIVKNRHSTISREPWMRHDNLCKAEQFQLSVARWTIWHPSRISNGEHVLLHLKIKYLTKQHSNMQTNKWTAEKLDKVNKVSHSLFSALLSSSHHRHHHHHRAQLSKKLQISSIFIFSLQIEVHDAASNSVSVLFVALSLQFFVKRKV